jgi:ribosomal protein S18 acetylase RimI-like enzyme
MSVRRALPEDAPAISQVLARAFDTDPFTSWLVRSDARRADGFKTFFDVATVKLTMPHGECWVVPQDSLDGVKGAALWTPPGKWRMGFWRQLAHGPSFVRTISWSRLGSRLKGTNDITARHHARPPHYYLFLLGVDPASQGQGLGTALTRPVLEKCDAEGMPAYLETAMERNVQLYQRLGFRVLEEFRPRGDCPLLYLMWREPVRPQ